jgi:hypothetical protein
MAVARVGVTWPRPRPGLPEGGRSGVVDSSTYTNTAVAVLGRQRNCSSRGDQDQGVG